MTARLSIPTTLPRSRRGARTRVAALAILALAACGRISPLGEARPRGPATALTAAEACAAIPAPPPAAVRADPGCGAIALPGMDDGSSAAVALPSAFSWFGGSFGAAYVNNNGDVSFSRGFRSAYWPFGALSVTPPFIAPFLGDVDTRPAGTLPVTYGDVAFGGRPALCVDWVDVGYYNLHASPLDSFQLVLVDRSDVAPGDFDFVMGYDRMGWDQGDFVRSPAGAGYAPGEIAPALGFEFPGSLVSGAFLDGNDSTGLARTSRNSLVPGRHLFEVRGGLAPLGGSVAGQVLAGGPLAGAPVQVCAAGGATCVVTVTNASGRYLAKAVGEGDRVVTAFPPAGSTLAPGSTGPVYVAGTGVTQVDVTLASPLPLPAGASLAPSTPGCAGVPVVYGSDATTLSVQACAGGSATFAVTGGGAALASGPMVEGPSGTYQAAVPALAPSAGLANAAATVACPGGATESATFDLYVSPAWLVRAVTGEPLAGATVTLLRADGSAGPFEAVPAGSAAMSPMNRLSPALTDAGGRFGWDLVAGHYVVRAELAGCTSETGAPYAESAVLTVPPAPALDLRLSCGVAADTTPPVLSGIPAPFTVEATGASGAVATWAAPTAVDAVDGSVPVTCSPASGSIFPLGATAVTCSASDSRGNVASASFAVTVVDTVAPVVSPHADVVADATSASGATVSFTVTATDAVDPAPIVSCAPPSGSVFPLGTSTVTCTATDASGNVPAPMAFNVTVRASAAYSSVVIGPAPAAFNVPIRTSAAWSSVVTGAQAAPAAFSVPIRGSAAWSSAVPGPQAKEAPPKLAAGSAVSVGYSLAMPLSPHPADTVQLRGATVTFAATCVNKADGPGGTIVVPIPDGTYPIPANDTTWYPTGDQASPPSFQATGTIPAICGSGLVSLKPGAMFRAGLTWIHKTTSVRVRFHYGAAGRKESWSAARQATPY